MDNLQDFNSFNEGIKDKLKLRWEKFKDELHPWDFTLDQWNDKWDKSKSKPKPIVSAPKKQEYVRDVPRNPYSVEDFNNMIRSGDIIRCHENVADFVWVYRSGKIVYFRKVRHNDIGDSRILSDDDKHESENDPFGEAS